MKKHLLPTIWEILLLLLMGYTSAQTIYSSAIMEHISPFSEGNPYNPIAV